MSDRIHTATAAMYTAQAIADRALDAGTLTHAYASRGPRWITSRRSPCIEGCSNAKVAIKIRWPKIAALVDSAQGFAAQQTHGLH